MVSAEEYARVQHDMAGLDMAGQWAEAEALARRMLARHPTSDRQRARILGNLALWLMRQDKLEEALDWSQEAMTIAHQERDVVLLAGILDLRAQIRCRAEDYRGALRSLEAAAQYLREGGGHEPHLDARMAHTRGMAYAGCGWWEAAAEPLRIAVHTFEALQTWQEWGTAIHDVATATLMQAEAEGPDPDALVEAIGLLDAARAQFARTANPSMRLQATLGSLMARGALAAARQDAMALWEVLTEYRAVFEHDGERTGVLLHRSNAPLLMYWVGGRCRAGRAWAALAGPDWPRQAILGELEEQEALLERALSNAPRHVALWCERAALHRCRARHGLEDSGSAAVHAKDCMEHAIDSLCAMAAGYSDPQFRAGWLGSASGVLEELAATAAFALQEARPAQPDVAARMVSLAQFLRARGRQDLVRDLAHLQQLSPADRAELAELQARMRSLQWWLMWLNASDYPPPRESRPALGAMVSTRQRDPVATLHSATAAILHRYPEYANLKGSTVVATRAQVAAELRRSKVHFAHREAASVLLRAQAIQLEHEAPWEVAALQKAPLQAGDVVLDYYVGPSALHVGIIAPRHCEVLRLPRTTLRDISTLARTLSPPAGPLDRRRDLVGEAPGPGPWAEALEQLSAWLLPRALVTRLTALGTRRLYVVASGPLWRIPFSWLRADGPLALDRWEICLVPSARLAGREVDGDPLRSAFAVGHAGEPPLEHVAADVRAAGAWLGCRVPPQHEVTPSYLLREVLPVADVLHIACHGTCDPVSPLLSGLLLEPDGDHGDGRLWLYEVLGVPLRAFVISLGACHTARSDGPVAFPESLAHALLGAGARFVLGSLWAADDRECRRFHRDFYRALTRVPDPVAAFHAAQRRQVARTRRWAVRRRGTDTLLDTDLARMANFVLLGARRLPDA